MDMAYRVPHSWLIRRPSGFLLKNTFSPVIKSRPHAKLVPSLGCATGKPHHVAARIRHSSVCSGSDSFSHYRDGNFFYVVAAHDQKYSFPIPIEDAKDTTLFAEFKALTLMRWIRKAIKDKTFQLVRS
jgi:hypothetical protein